jgi:hypothetical protein
MKRSEVELMPKFFEIYLRNLKEERRVELLRWAKALMSSYSGSAENRIYDMLSAKSTVGRTIDARMTGATRYQEALLYLRSHSISFYNDRTTKGRSIKLGLYGDTAAAESKLRKLADKVTKSAPYMKSSGRYGLPDYQEEGTIRYHFYAKEAK